MNSHSIEDFIEHSTSIPRDVVRICKTVKEVDEMGNQINAELVESRKVLLANKKFKGEKFEENKLKIEKKYHNLLNLSQYKIDQLVDLELIVNNHIIELQNSIKEFEKEYIEQHNCLPPICKFFLTHSHSKNFN